MTVYPRWRGEHDIFIAVIIDLNGLSPLARGTPGTIQSKEIITRFIPAGAGNTPET